MTLKLVRVDDRLIHGQVVAVWLRAVGADRIIVVDDKVANDPIMKDFVGAAAEFIQTPVEVYNVTDGAPRVTELAAGPQQCFVIVRSPVTALKLRQAGVPFDQLNIGGIGAGPGRKSLYKNISASPEELEAMRTLETMGTRVEIRIVADDRPVAFTSVDKR